LKQYCGGDQPLACSGRDTECLSDNDCSGADFCFGCATPTGPTPAPPAPTPASGGSYCGADEPKACSQKLQSCRVDSECSGADFCFKCSGPAPTPAPPGPAPSGAKYLCNTATDTCEENSAAGQSKTQCEAVCKKHPVQLQ
jgi:hypothetical protein